MCLSMEVVTGLEVSMEADLASPNPLIRYYYINSRLNDIFLDYQINLISIGLNHMKAEMALSYIESVTSKLNIIIKVLFPE